ncbi:MAG: glycosyltransferase family A protein [Pseudomonadota bacterium]
MPDLVTIGVPVYRGGAFIAEALGSIRDQTHRELEVLISVDGGDPNDIAACEPFLDDPRFRLIVQPERLGWVGNIGALMDQAAGTYWCYHQQDDILKPDYIQALHATMAKRPRVAVAFSDIQCFGAVDWKITQAPVTGSDLARQLTLMTDHFNGVAFRGLTRVAALRSHGALYANEADDFAAETVWMSAIARAGPLVRVPRLLYAKRYHQDNIHTKWAKWPVEKRLHAWCVHCRDMAGIALGIDAPAAEKRLIWAAAILRLMGTRVGKPYVEPAIDGAAAEERLPMFLRLCEAERDSFTEALEMPWQEIGSLARALIGTASPRLSA